MKWMQAAGLALLALVGAGIVSGDKETGNRTARTVPDYVDIKNGRILGEATDSYRKFIGIPYGAPPVGDLRFASPQPAPSWAPDTFNATQWGAACPGTIQALFEILPRFEASEDCLFVNVFTPNRERLTKPLPVLFFVYGGAFILGDGHELGMYDGTAMVSGRDVILVTHNYRLGPLGFLVVEGGADGNYGIEDQRLALRWVIDNIASFGGDPTQITIFGESAGAMSIGIHLTSPLSTGLFQRAILESNALGLQYLTRQQALSVSAKLARLVGCAEGDLACLRAQDWRKISYAHLPVFPAGVEHLIGDILTWAPTVDGKNLLRNPIDSFALGEFQDIPTIWGANSDEMTLFTGLIESGLDALGLLLGRDITLDIGPIAYNLLIGILFREAADQVKDRYPPSLFQNNLPLLSQILTEYVFVCSSRFAALKMSAGKSQVLTYEFTHVPKWSPLLERLNRACFVDHVCHAMELPYVFHPEKLSIIPISDNFTPEEEVMSQNIMNYWAAFASGNVNSNNPPVVWEPFVAGKQSLLDINTNPSLKVWDSNTCDFWDSIGYKY